MPLNVTPTKCSPACDFRLKLKFNWLTVHFSESSLAQTKICHSIDASAKLLARTEIHHSIVTSVKVHARMETRHSIATSARVHVQMEISLTIAASVKCLTRMEASLSIAALAMLHNHLTSFTMECEVFCHMGDKELAPL